MATLLIGGKWQAGHGEVLASRDPASGEIVWEGACASPQQAGEAVGKARAAFASWGRLEQEARDEIVGRFSEILNNNAEELSRLISRETGKLLWDAQSEVTAMIGKIAISREALHERAGTRMSQQPFGRAALRHRPHGVMVVLGPYNFPGHLPNGHIVPALLAGNTVVFKPSEKTPAVGEYIAKCWGKAGLPDGVFNLVQGGRDVGEVLVAADIDGLLFTGSAAAGATFRRQFVDRPHVILALELGGNNPLIAWDNPEASASIAIHSAFVTSGQRCSCARRLIVPEGRAGDSIIEALVEAAGQVRVGAWDDERRNFMGPLIDDEAARAAKSQARQIVAEGGSQLRGMLPVDGHRDAFVTPGVIKVDPSCVRDEEVFAPLLQVMRARDFDQAIQIANATRFGLSAGLVSADPDLWERFRIEVRAGVVNWNRPTTGASSAMPFGGLGDSGNHRPSAYYAADYCAYPVASFESAEPEIMEI
jgi:succinylglutamic semialdehyde dehydrogenase